MNRLQGIVAALVAVVAVAGLVPADEPKPAEHNRVVAIEGTKPVRVQLDEVIRLEGGGIAGAKVTAEVSGPAKLLAKNVVRRVIDGNMVFGPSGVEFLVKPAGKGTAFVTITVKNPTSETAEVTKYEFTIVAAE